MEAAAMLLLTVLAAAMPVHQARASARIVRPIRVSEEWRISPQRREVVVRENGRAVAIRLIEFE